MKEFDVDNVSKIKLSEVRPNTWNPKLKNTREYRKVLASIKRDGQKLPVVVRELEGKDGSKFEILDGEQRWTALKELGRKEVIIYNSGVVKDEDAKNETLWTQLQVPFDNLLLAPIVAELNLKGLELPFEDDMIQELIDIEQFQLEEMLKEQKEDEPADDMPDMEKFAINVTPDQLAIIKSAMQKVKDEFDANMSDGRALELLCGDYLAGVSIE